MSAQRRPADGAAPTGVEAPTDVGTPTGWEARTLEAGAASERILRREGQLAAKRWRRHRLTVIAARVGLVVLGLVAWELASGRIVRPFYVSDPVTVGEELLEWATSDAFWYHARFTLTATALGYLLGASAAILLAWPLGLLHLAYRVVEPYFLVAYSVPAVALGPVFILWFGIGLAPKVLLAAYFVFFVVFINTVTGLRQVPPGQVAVTRVMGASRWQALRHVLAPGAAPYVLAALRVTLPAAMIGAVVGEFIASNRGIGFLTRQASARYATGRVLAGVIVLAGIVLILGTVLHPLSRALRWRPDVNLKGQQT
jgi:NitT/TauT family transport system permease protein